MMLSAPIRFAELFWTGMLVHLWQTTLVLALLWVLSRALRNAPARLQASLWSIGLLKLFLPLSLLAPLASRLVDYVAQRLGTAPVATRVEWISATFWLYPVTGPTSVETAARASSALYAVMLVAWWLGLGWILARRLARVRRASRPLWNAPSPRRERLESSLRLALRPTDIPRKWIVLVQGSGMPAVRGLFRPRIELPARVAESLAPPDLTAVLLHEAEHCRRRDPLRQLPGAVASWLFFFFPPVRWLLRRVHECTEMACDEAVLSRGIASHDYVCSIARTLQLGLEQAEALPAFLGHGNSSLRRRLARLELDRRYRTMALHRIILALAALVALLGSVVPLTSGTQTDPETPSAAAASARFAALDDLSGVDNRVTLEFDELAAGEILKALARVAGVKLELGPAVGENGTSISLSNGTVREALIELAGLAGLHYTVPDPGTLRVGATLLPGKDGVTAPVLLQGSMVQPRYPEEMRKAGVQGKVILQAIIDSNGNVTEVTSLSADHSAMVETAVEAIEQWRYEPATLDGKPVAVYFTIVVKYALDDHAEKIEEGGETL